MFIINLPMSGGQQEYPMYRDNSGNEFHSFEEACIYYGVDTPAQAAAEEAYWAEVEAERFAQAEMNDAVIYDPCTARWALNVAAGHDPSEEDMPF
jgi:hypothetical protein